MAQNLAEALRGMKGPEVTKEECQGLLLAHLRDLADMDVAALDDARQARERRQTIVDLMTSLGGEGSLDGLLKSFLDRRGDS